jgi:hypothetical protein
MSINGVKTAIKTAIEANLTGIPCYTSVPGSPEIPCAFITPRTGNYLINWPQGKVQIAFDVTLLLAKGDLIENVQDVLDTYLLPTGTNSMKAALELADLTGHADWLRVESFDYGGYTYSGVEYLGAKWHVQVMI